VLAAVLGLDHADADVVLKLGDLAVHRTRPLSLTPARGRHCCCRCGAVCTRIDCSAVPSETKGWARPSDLGGASPKIERVDRDGNVSRETAWARRMQLNSASIGWRITCAVTPSPIK